MTTIRSKQVKVHIIAYFALHDQYGVIAKKLSLMQTTILCELFVAAAVVASLTACLLLRTRVLIRTSNMKNSRRHLAAYVRKLHQKACCTGRAAQLFFLIQPIKSSTREGGKKEKYIYIFFISSHVSRFAQKTPMNVALPSVVQAHRTTGNSWQDLIFFCNNNNIQLYLHDYNCNTWTKPARLPCQEYGTNEQPLILG